MPLLLFAQYIHMFRHIDGNEQIASVLAGSKYIESKQSLQLPQLSDTRQGN